MELQKMNQQNIIVVFIRHYENKDAKPLTLYALVNQINSWEPNWTNNESEAFVFNKENFLLFSLYRKQICKHDHLQQTFNILKEEIAWKLTDLPETKHESNGWRKEYVKP